MRISLFLLFTACTETPIGAVDDKRALAIANEYKSWGRVDDELRWAPFLCRQPMPGVAYMSEANDPNSHGQKLYSVFAKDRAAYPDGTNSTQVVVKESYIPELVTDPNFMWSPPWNSTDPNEDHFYPYAQKDGKTYHAGASAGLFIMYRSDSADSDAGWIYATVSADKKVTGSGKIALCVNCHVNADHGRLFGVPQSPLF